MKGCRSLMSLNVVLVTILFFVFQLDIYNLSNMMTEKAEPSFCVCCSSLCLTGVPAAARGFFGTTLPSWWVSTFCCSFSSVPSTPRPLCRFGTDCSGDETPVEPARRAFLITLTRGQKKHCFYAPLYRFSVRSSTFSSFNE